MAVLRVIGTTRDIARVHGVSERTARRIAPTIPGARRVGGRWFVPLTTREYASARNVSVRTAQRRALHLTGKITEREIIRAERRQRDEVAARWFARGKPVLLAKELHNPLPLPLQRGYQYTMIADVSDGIYLSRSFLFSRRVTAHGLLRNWRVRRWLVEIARRYQVDVKQIRLTLRGAYRHGEVE